MPRWVVANEDPDEEESSEEGTEAEEGDSEEEEQEELELEADEGPSKLDDMQEPAAKRQKISLQLGKQELRCHVGPITMLSPYSLPSSNHS